jgi:hypothetical protein
MPTQGRLGDNAVAPQPGEVQLLGDGDEGAQVAEIHRGDYAKSVSTCFLKMYWTTGCAEAMVWARLSRHEASTTLTGAKP